MGCGRGSRCAFTGWMEDYSVRPGRTRSRLEPRATRIGDGLKQLTAENKRSARRSGSASK